MNQAGAMTIVRYCIAAMVAVLVGCGGGGGGGGTSAPVPSTPTPRPSATPATHPTTTPTATPTALPTATVRPTIAPTTAPTATPVPSSTPVAAAFVCPTSDSVSGAARAAYPAGEARRILPYGTIRASTQPAATAVQLVAVTFDAQLAARSGDATLAARENALGATFKSRYAFNHVDLVTHVVAIPSAQSGRIEAALRALPGVRNVSPTGARRYPTSVNQPYFTNDPYFEGFTAPTGGYPATFEAEPLVEGASVPGQWDMHVMRLEWAFEYSQTGNGSGVTAPGALGSSNVKIAVIDTGEDTTHPELASKIVYQRCFISNPAGIQSTSDDTTDEDGHGTDVAGIAAAASSNQFGFTGAGGNSVLYGYRVFPTPDDNCAKPGSSDVQCGADTRDIASAIEDAVAQRVNVISLSLGGGACANGQDPDAVEGAAIADAIAANIIVVAAAGNASGPPVDAPACDPGVIAVGATAIADGVMNGSKKGGGSVTAFEYVASYTDNGTPGAAAGSASAWGIVAPGGDPSDDKDADDLHWIENIWTTTPFDAMFGDPCRGDYPSESGTLDCRVLIAGTSMSTPHVAGAAALILAVAPRYQSPAAMKALLCSTAADIGDSAEGCGRLDVYRAMAVAIGDPNVPASSPIP